MLARFSRYVLVSVNTLLLAAPAAAQYSSITDLGDLGGGASIATSINARGQIAGASLREGATTEGGFIWQKGVMTDLGSLGGANTVAYAINNRGQVVGGSNRADASVGGFVWQNGAMTDLGGAISFALGINDRGQVVGLVYDADLSSISAFVWEKGVMTKLPPIWRANWPA